MTTTLQTTSCPGSCSPIAEACNRALDRVTLPAAAWSKANQVSPHRASWGAAIVVLPTVAAIASFSWVAPAALVATLIAYLRVYIPAKRRLLKGARRKLLIDLTLFVAPVFVGLCWVGGLDVLAAADALAFVTAVGIVLLRSGCFFAGCCRGGPSRVGARYPGVVGRFVPLPLLEMVVGSTLLCTAMGMRLCGAPSGALLVPMAGLYAGYRFFSEFLRARSGPFAVRRVLGLSITQWLCATTVALVTVGAFA